MAGIEALYTNYHTELIRWCRGMTGNNETARELVQEGFVKALQHEETVTSLREEQAKAWLYRTIRNLYIDRIRHTSKECMVEELPEQGGVTPDEYAEIEIAQLLQTLPGIDRKIFVLRYVEGLSSTQIGEIYGLPPGTVRAKLSTARTLLRTALSGR